MAVKTVFPIYKKDCYVSNNTYKSFKLFAPDDLTFTDDPKEADLQIVFEVKFSGMTRFLGLRKIMDRNLVAIGEDDKRNYPIVPGIYVSITKGFANPNRASSHAYLSYLAETDGNPYCKGYVDTPKEYLCSFVGKCKMSVREKIFRTLHDRPGFLIKDTFNTYNHFEGSRVESEQKSYVQIIRASEFSICPRGGGASSIRLFESMRLGVAPIILADAWVPPIGPLWEEFSFRVKEKEVDRIPDIVNANRHKHKEMGLLARKAWEDYFSPKAIVPDILQQLEKFSKHKSFERTRRFKGYIHQVLVKIFTRLSSMVVRKVLRRSSKQV